MHSQNFTILESLGKGGFGSAIKCRAEKDQKEYALKVFVMESVLTEPDPRKRHVLNLTIAKKVKNEYDLQVLCAKDCKHVANAYGMALN